MYQSFSWTLSNQTRVRNKLFNSSSLRQATRLYSTAEFVRQLKKFSQHDKPIAAGRSDRFKLLHNIPSCLASVNYLGPLVESGNVNESIQRHSREKQRLPGKEYNTLQEIKVEDLHIPKYVRVKLSPNQSSTPSSKLVLKYSKFKPENELRLQKKRDRYSDQFMDEQHIPSYLNEKYYDVNINDVPTTDKFFTKELANDIKLKNYPKITESAILKQKQKISPADVSTKYEYNQFTVQNSETRNRVFNKIFSHINEDQLKSNRNVDSITSSPPPLRSDLVDTFPDLKSQRTIERISKNHTSALQKIKAMINRYGADHSKRIKLFGNQDKYIYDRHLFDDQMEPPSTARATFSSKPPEKRKRLQISEKNASRKEQLLKIKQERNFTNIQKKSIHIQVNIPGSHPIQKYGTKVEWDLTAVINSLRHIMHKMLSNKQKYIDRIREIFGIGKRRDSVEDFPKLTESDEILFDRIQQRKRSNFGDDEIIEKPIQLTKTVNPAGILNTRNDYYTIPNMNDLVPYVDEVNKTCIVNNFTIGRIGFGIIEFVEPVDVYNLNVDKAIEFTCKNIDLYPNEVEKPAIGEGLNKAAKVSLFGVWPTDKTTNELIKDEKQLKLLKFKTMLISICDKRNFQFISYCARTGCWMFLVDHF